MYISIKYQILHCLYLVYSVTAQLVELFPDVVVDGVQEQLHVDPAVFEGGGGRHEAVQRPPRQQPAHDLVPQRHGPLVAVADTAQPHRQDLPLLRDYRGIPGGKRYGFFVEGTAF